MSRGQWYRRLPLACALLLAGALACPAQKPASPDTTAARPPDPKVTRPGADKPEPKVPKAFAAGRPVAATVDSSFAALRSKAIGEQARLYPKKGEGPEAPPLSLTASDGTGLVLERFTARAALEGPLALTELHLVFRNPQPRVIEGRFSITLPQAAAISRFAMKLPGGWQEAEVVERRAAQEAYEDFLHRRQDPALLEKKAGNEFSARIFPIPPSGEKEIKLSYSQEIASTESTFRLPLRGLPELRQLDLTVLYSKRDAAGVCLDPKSPGVLSPGSVRLAQQRIKPQHDLILHTAGGCKGAAGPASKPPQGLRHENLVLARLRPTLTTDAAPIASLLVLLDTSASRAAGFASQVELLGKLAAVLAPETKLQVACFDQVVTPIFEGEAGKLAESHLQEILERRALGASNLHAALVWAAARKDYKRLLLLTDGVATAGLTDGAELVKAAKQLRAGFERIDAIGVGGIRDEDLLRRLVRGTAAKDGVLLDGDRPVTELAERLRRTTVSGIEVDVKGARWVWPSRLDGVQPDDEVLVYADLPTSALSEGKPLTVSLSGPLKQSHEVELYGTQRPLLERAWVAAKIARLIDERDRAGERELERAAKVKQEIISLSTKHRVLSDYTALLVLETEYDYTRFGIDRKALSDILVVGKEGVQVLTRKDLVLAEANQPPPDTDGAADADQAVRPPRHAVGGHKAGRLGMLRGKGGSGRGAGGAPAGEAVGGAPGAREERQEAKRTASAAPETKARPAPAAPKAESREQEAPLAAAPARQLAAKRAVSKQAVSGLLGRSRDVAGALRGPGQSSVPALTGKMAEVAGLIKAGKAERAVLEALRWRAEDEADILALVSLGDALKASGRKLLAARAYGSIIDLFPSRADMRRYAGMLLESLGDAGQGLAADSFADAVLQRPDHPNSHRLLGYALLRLGELPLAFAAIEAGAKRGYPSGRFLGVDRILREDLALIGAAWRARDPQRAGEIERRLREAGSTPETEPTLRFVLSWETDANDVDFHIHDGQGGHAFYGAKVLPSGGSLYADVTTGYGPECFTIPGKPRGFPYRLQIHYFSRGPMGYGMGKLEIIQHDGKGGLTFEQRPYVVMVDRAFVDLGVVEKPL